MHQQQIPIRDRVYKNKPPKEQCKCFTITERQYSSIENIFVGEGNNDIIDNTERVNNIMKLRINGFENEDCIW